MQQLQEDAPSLRVFHYMMPHTPYLYDRLGPVPLEKVQWDTRWNEAGYTGNLFFVDVVIGDLLDALKASESYNETLFVMTADHSVRSDPDLLPNEDAGDMEFRELCRVPLLIHLPGQMNSIDIATPFSHAWLKDILVDYVDGKIDRDGFVERCRGFREMPVEFVIDRSKVFRPAGQ